MQHAIQMIHIIKLHFYIFFDDFLNKNYIFTSLVMGFLFSVGDSLENVQFVIDDGVPGEMLLLDDHGQQQAQFRQSVLVPPSLPSWNQDHARFSARMLEAGFRSSPTQMSTPADGDCGIWAILGIIYILILLSLHLSFRPV